ncbi:MAG: hypothetical protein KGI75_30350, partial [Rhizobiaceae bacterium]|nr:hypothetical protein [Rhizobiaceae bacterium]
MPLSHDIFTCPAKGFSAKAGKRKFPSACTSWILLDVLRVMHFGRLGTGFTANFLGNRRCNFFVKNRMLFLILVLVHQK